MRNVKTISIWSCDSLRNVFPPCIARDLIHLKWLTELPNFTSFWCYLTGEDLNYKVEFPNLVDLDIGCEKINLGAKELGIDDSTCQRLKVLKYGYCGKSTALALSAFRSLPLLQDLKISDSSSLEEIVEDVRGDEVSDMDKKTPTLLQLKYFTLENLPNIKRFIINANFECHMPTLTRVMVHYCGISTLFTFSALKSLPHLRELEISRCSLLEEIVEGVRGDEASCMDTKTITLFHLRSIILRNLPNLKSFISTADYECHMPALRKVIVDNCRISPLLTFSALRSLQQLQELEISNCCGLKEMVEGVGGDEASGLGKKTITFYQLRSVTLTNLEYVGHVIYSNNYDFHMPTLTKLNIHNCDFYTLFMISDFRKLHQLSELNVSNCRRLESIVDDKWDDKSSFGDDKIITFSRLTNVRLTLLPNLKCFSSTSSYSFSMPKLDTLKMFSCPRMEYFTFLKTSTPMVRVYIEREVWEHIPDLNDYIRQNCKRENSTSDSVGKLSHIEQERVEEEQPQNTKENDQQ
ncbi:hypothetical protein POM88_037352 [Heracleum sosnowskyi]|uniref:Disease resistance protein At4g27190-like leucine-rich repeats domain-containing protein n=1 Tax=Heracleum sosnowskyi TaxID=360622 RepID=A0AAD8HSE4_9APIA|nr:hypothetical protein POM88_037352 [Heracleum sosnowskyi]